MKGRSNMLDKGDKVGLIACSDGLKLDRKEAFHQLLEILIELGLDPVVADNIFRSDFSPFSGTPKERAKSLEQFYRDPSIKAIFDVSGGDSANEILPFINFDRIRKHPKPFVGLSDLTVLLNAIYQKTNLPTYHFQIMTLVKSMEQINHFKQFWFNNRLLNIPQFNYHFLRGDHLKEIIIGGNLRCFLKLAGTLYFPDTKGRILLVESLSGGPSRQASYLAQLDQLGVFKTLSGVLIGRFTTMENEKYSPTIEELVLTITEDYQLPVIKTEDVGHGNHGKVVPIGIPLTFHK